MCYKNGHYARDYRSTLPKKLMKTSEGKGKPEKEEATVIEEFCLKRINWVSTCYAMTQNGS